MNESLKQRLVGAVVLVCFGLILWPVLFSESSDTAMSRQSQIPPAPEFEKYRAVPAKQPANLKPVSAYKPQPEQALEQIAKTAGPAAGSLSKPVLAKVASKPMLAKSDKPSLKVAGATELNEQGLPVYWALQVASFLDQEKAQRLRSELIKLGYKVDSRKIRTSSGESIRVYVGPKLDKALLIKEQAKIDSRFDVKSIVVRFSQ